MAGSEFLVARSVDELNHCGIIGGIIAIAIITYLVWRFLIKPKRSKVSLAVYAPDEDVPHDMEKDGSIQLNRRLSTHTVHSIASTVLTRASNIIQIAYIPGVTNRTTPSPNNLVPPVPPIPTQHAAGGQMDQHFFVPGNLRDSTYSGISGYSDRTSYARTSFAPRASIASTIYGKQAQVLTPAQTGMRAKPTMVSVKNGNSPNTPPIPNIDFDKYLRPKSTASTFSVGSTFLNSANTATQARAQVVKLPASGLRKVEVGSNPEDRPLSTATLGASSIGSKAATESGRADNEGPFSDPKSPQEASRERESEDDTLAADRKSKRGSSPFGDEHATRD
ncbi:hypothetical protein ESCO_005012 [Escovopsis weberi]|uniref:Opy2 protein n=1 Tax=Escovopsis weberi TaxID=150374 RepID=A0A0M8MY43_ESCWE|nr:hypothetical protein ESCO_005012 [Escovopsis weberi]